MVLDDAMLTGMLACPGQAEGDPARIAVAYERAVAAFPVTKYLWAAYARSLEQRLRGVPGVASAVYARAVRNCPWVGLLWARCSARTFLLRNGHTQSTWS